MTHVQQLAAALLDALEIELTCGAVTLNFNDRELQTVKTETFLRVAQKPIDRRTAPRV